MLAKGKLRIKFLVKSESNEYLVQPDIVENDSTMCQSWIELILGTNTLKASGIIPNVGTKEIDIDGIILPMRDIHKLSTRAKIERA